MPFKLRVNKKLGPFLIQRVAKTIWLIAAIKSDVEIDIY